MCKFLKILFDPKNLFFSSRIVRSLSDGGELKKSLERIAIKFGAIIEQVTLG